MRKEAIKQEQWTGQLANQPWQEAHPPKEAGVH